MKDNLSIAIMMIILVLLAVIFPLYNYFERQDDMSYNLVLKATTNFADEVMNCGYISQEMYDSYVSNIANTGNLYDIQLEAKRKVFVKSQNGISYEEQFAVDYNDEIFNLESMSSNSSLDSRVIKDGVYKLNAGDQIYVKVKNSSTSMAAAIFQTIVPTATKETIKVNYGGIVKNNAWKQAEVSDVARDEIVISYDTMGGTPMSVAPTKKEIYLGEEDVIITLSSVTPTRNGRIFLGWHEDKFATEAKYQSGASYSFSSSTKLYAIYDIKNVDNPTITVRRKDNNDNVPSNTWVNSDDIITISSANDEYTTYYSLDDGNNWTPYSGEFVYSNEGSNVILAKSKFENRESSNTTFVAKIDKTAPTRPSFASVSSTRTSITVESVSGSTDGENGSGVYKYQYSLNGSNWKDDNKFTGLSEGTKYNIYIRAVDNAGNNGVILLTSATTQSAPVRKIEDVANIGDYISFGVSGSDMVDNDYICCWADYSTVEKWLVIGIYQDGIKVVPKASTDFDLEFKGTSNPRRNYSAELQKLYKNISSDYINKVGLPTESELVRVSYGAEALLSTTITGDSGNSGGIDAYNIMYVEYYNPREKCQQIRKFTDKSNTSTYLCPALYIKLDAVVSGGDGSSRSPFTLK